MRGYIREYRQGKFSYTVDVGKVNGKRKKIERGGFTTKSEAERALSIKLAELATTGEIFIPTEKTLEEVFNDFLRSAIVTRKDSTIRKHKSIFKTHILEVLGHRYVKTLKASDIDELTALKVSQGYSSNYVKSISKTLYAVLEHALQRGEIKENVMYKSINIKPPKSKVEIFTTEEINAILKALENSTCIIPTIVALYTGMRRAETLALRWSDICFKKDTITVNKQLSWFKNGYCLDSPKSTCSIRTIKMGSTLKEYLLELKQRQQEDKEMACEYWQENTVYNFVTKKEETIKDFICVNRTGKMINGESIKYIQKTLKKQGIDFKFHKLRHTHATQLLENGATIKLVQERLGHASPRVTLETYSHVTPAFEVNILDTIPAYLSDKTCPTKNRVGHTSDTA